MTDQHSEGRQPDRGSDPGRQWHRERARRFIRSGGWNDVFALTENPIWMALGAAFGLALGVVIGMLRSR